MPGRTGVAESASDARALKIVASLERHTIADGRERPRVAVELFDPALVPVAEASYAGPLLAVPGDLVLGRSLALGTLYPGLSSFFADVLDPRRGVAVGVHRVPELAGATLSEAITRLSNGVLLGAIREKTEGADALAWRSETVLAPRDPLLLMTPSAAAPALGPPHATASAEMLTGPDSPLWAGRRLLIVGWSGLVPDLFAELVRQDVALEIDLLALADPTEREATLRGLLAGSPLRVRHHQGDPTSPQVVKALSLESYDALVVLGGGGASTTADSCAIASLLVLDHCLQGADRIPHRIVEISDPGNADLLESRGVEVVQAQVVAQALAGALVDPQVWSLLPQLLAGVVGRPAALPAAALLGANGVARPCEFESALRRRDLIWIGVQRAASGFAVELAPDKDEPIRAADGDRLVVIRPTAS